MNEDKVIKQIFFILLATILIASIADIFQGCSKYIEPVRNDLMSEENMLFAVKDDDDEWVEVWTLTPEMGLEINYDEWICEEAIIETLKIAYPEVWNGYLKKKNEIYLDGDDGEKIFVLRPIDASVVFMDGWYCEDALMELIKVTYPVQFEEMGK